jgi:hypothetical protein
LPQVFIPTAMTYRSLPGWLVSISLIAPVLASSPVELESRDGRKITAEVIEVREDSVLVKKADGKESTIPFSRLTDASVAKARDAIKTPVADAVPDPVAKANAKLSPTESSAFAAIFAADTKYWESVILGKKEEVAPRLKELEDLIAGLEKSHEALDVEEKCARAVNVAQGKLPGAGRAEVQIGAAVYLGRLEGDPVIESLYVARKTELPSGVELACNRALGRRCTGEFMKKVVTDFVSAEKDTNQEAGSILMNLATREQADELKALAPMVTSQEAKERWAALFSLLRHLYR